MKIMKKKTKKITKRISKRMIFISLPHQLARQAFLRLDTGFQCSDKDMAFVQSGTNLFEDETLHPFE